MTQDKEQNNTNEELESSKKQATAGGGAPQNAVAEEYLNNWKRERADFINYKKEEGKRIENFAKFANESLIMDLIDKVDGLIMAIKEYPPELKEKSNSWFAGIQTVANEMGDLLSKYGVDRIEVKGQKFDPMYHEAVEVKDKEGQNIEEIRPGYTMHGKVIRPARVRIIK